MATDLFHNLLTRDALLIHDGVAYPLTGPFPTREDAERAAERITGQQVKRYPGLRQGLSEPQNS